MSLIKKFYEDPYMQVRSTALNLLASLAISLMLYEYHATAFYRFHFFWWQLGLIPLGIYVGGVSVVYIHNATHNNFRWRWLNECCGYLSGMHQLWGFKGWQLIHLVHHQYMDVDAMDPHKHSDLTFWQYAMAMAPRSNAKIRERYREHWGVSQRTRFFQSQGFISFISAALVAGNLLFWYMLLGPAAFIFFYIPSFIANYMLVADVNYSAHPKDPATLETQPANLNDRFYHKICNALFSGIYYHANHHRKPLLFNPKKMPVRPAQAAPSEATAAG